MALSTLGTGGNNEGLRIADSSFLTLVPDWTLFVMFRPDSAITKNTFGYLYAHGTPVSNVAAITIVMTMSNTIRVIVDQPSGTITDYTTSNAAADDLWNGLAVEYNGTRFQSVLNGIFTTSFPPSAGTVNPAGAAALGFATHVSGGDFSGRICHWSKWDRSLKQDELSRYTKALVSPEFAQQDKSWHIEAFNTGNKHDLQNNVTVTEAGEGAFYGPHANAAYPIDPHDFTFAKVTFPGPQNDMSQWTFM